MNAINGTSLPASESGESAEVIGKMLLTWRKGGQTGPGTSLFTVLHLLGVLCFLKVPSGKQHLVEKVQNWGSGVVQFHDLSVASYMTFSKLPNIQRS